MEADVVILASPVYVYHATGQMMAFLDHFGTRWMVHRPDGTCLPEAGRGDCDSCRRWHGEHDEGSLPQYVFLGLSADLPHGICCQGSEAIRDPGRYPEEDPPGDRPDGSKDPKKSCPIQTNTQDPHVVFDDTLDAQSILEVRAGLWLLGRTWMAR